MKASLRLRLDQLSDRFEELDALLADPAVINDNKRYRDLSREHSDLGDLVHTWRQWLQAEADLVAAQEMRHDPELRDLAEDEVKAAQASLARLEATLNVLMIPRDPHDRNAAFLEIRAGTGGDEAALFAGDLFRMYARHAEKMGWRVEILSENEGEHGGYREVISRVVGDGVYGRLKFESGAHRVQRVPATEAQGRIHTSACTVAIMPEADEDTPIDLNPADLRVDTFRASGAGGQHINKTDSAIRITHLPTGVVVECQQERSQHANRDKAMKILVSRLEQARRDQQQAETASLRRNLVGSGDRSERIRTYNFPQGRLTDHRINLTLYKLDAIMDGDLSELLEHLHREHQADQLAQLAQYNCG